MKTNIVSLFFVIAIAVSTLGCRTPGMIFRGVVNDEGEHTFSPHPENWGLNYHPRAVKQFGRDAQRADLAYMRAGRIGQQYANLKKKFMDDGLSEAQANYVIRTQFLSRVDPEIRGLVAVRLGMPGYGYGGSYYPSGSVTAPVQSLGTQPAGGGMVIWNGAIWPTGVDPGALRR